MDSPRTARTARIAIGMKSIEPRLALASITHAPVRIFRVTFRTPAPATPSPAFPPPLSFYLTVADTPLTSTRLNFAPLRATACSLGRQPQEGEAKRIPSPVGAAAVFLGAMVCRRP